MRGIGVEAMRRDRENLEGLEWRLILRVRIKNVWVVGFFCFCFYSLIRLSLIRYLISN